MGAGRREHVAIDPGRRVVKIRSGPYSSHERSFDAATGE
jgi:hypothetical protein